MAKKDPGKVKQKKLQFLAQYKCLEPTESAMLSTLLMGERYKDFTPPEDPPPILQIVQKRIDVYKLPISFTKNALFSILAFCSVPGEAMVFLIDALQKYEGQEVNVEMICRLYPTGFYTKESCKGYVDGFIKPKKTKWAEIY